MKPGLESEVISFLLDQQIICSQIFIPRASVCVRSPLPPPLPPRSMKSSPDIPSGRQNPGRGSGMPRERTGALLGSGFCDPSLAVPGGREAQRGWPRGWLKTLSPPLFFFLPFSLTAGRERPGRRAVAEQHYLTSAEPRWLQRPRRRRRMLSPGNPRACHIHHGSGCSAGPAAPVPRESC